MYYKYDHSSLIECAVCKLVKTDNPNVEFHPIEKDGKKIYQVNENQNKAETVILIAKK